MRISLHRRSRFLLMTLAIPVSLTLSGMAQGFYFKGWPGDGIPRETILINPKVPPYANPPGVPPGPGDEPPKLPPELPKEFPPEGQPPGVPEPATGLAALLGLAAVAAARRWRRKR